jgi:glycosyltransferase involved in cell wall biosynthesis
MRHETSRLRLSAVMIARNERGHVAPCFASFWDHVDEVVLCDTGSRDGTVAEARRFARERAEPGKLVVGHFKWCDDFAAARNHAASLASGSLYLWIDCDERLLGGESLREVAAELLTQPRLSMVGGLWRGPASAEGWRPLLLRAGVRWQNRTMEAPAPGQGEAGWTHRISLHHERRIHHGRRDLDIALRWADEEPRAWLPLQAAAQEAGELMEWDIVLDCCDRALTRARLPVEQRGSFLSMRAHGLAALGDRAGAEKLVCESIDCSPEDRSDWLSSSWLLRARLLFARRAYDDALHCAQRSGELAMTEEPRLKAQLLAAHIAEERDGSISAGFAQARSSALWKRSRFLPDVAPERAPAPWSST